MKRSSKAIVLFVAPPVGMVVVLILYAITSFGIVNAGETALVVWRIVRTVLGLFGVVAVAGFWICWPVAIYLLVTKGKEKKT